MPLQPSRFVLTVLPRAVLVVVAIVAILPALASLTGNDEVASTLGGDFASFYAAGEIVLDGRIDELYDPVVQQEYQATHHDDSDEFLYFAYPPFTAVAYSLLAWMPYGVALAAHALLSLGCVVLSMWLILPKIDAALSRTSHAVLGAALALAVLPLTVAVLGGQNTAFTLLLFSLVWYLTWSDRSALAGVAAGLMLFKPQFGLLMIVFLIVALKVRSAIAAVGVGAALYVATALAVGWSWPSLWVDQVQSFAELNAEVNGHLLVNISGWITNLAGDGTSVLLVTGAMWIAAAVASGWCAYRFSIEWVTIGVLVGGVLLLSPSSLFYDAGVAVVAFGVWAVSRSMSWSVIAAAVVATWTAPFASGLGWNPLFVVIAWLFVLQVYVLTRASSGSDAAESVSQGAGTLAAPDGQQQRRHTGRAIRSS
ncbi:MAG: glycosyltransferase family 87 protein [Acidimicrobiia bacterium]